MIEDIRLDEFINFNPKIELKKGTSYPYMEMANVDGVTRRIKTNYDKEYTSSGGAKFNVDDILFARIEPCLDNEKICQVFEKGFGSTEFFTLRANPNKCDQSFLFYLVKTEFIIQSALNSYSGASGRQRADLNFIKGLKINLPNLPTQKKIASVLSAYDDLIENNNQRIQLLEDMAQEIYKEWFVRFRFSDYQNTTFVDKDGNQVPHGTKGAVPKGWEKKPIDEFESFSISTSKLRKFQGEKRYLATADVTGIFITGEGELINWLNKPSRAQLKPELNSVFFARMSNTYKVLNFTESNYELVKQLALSSGFLGLKAKDKSCFPYLFTLIKSDLFHAYKDVYANGSTQVSLTNEGFHMIRLNEPNLELIQKFGEMVYPMYDEINILMKKNQVLQDTRDLLLPRLISGKLSVDNIPLPDNQLQMAAEPSENYK